jgi:hypothetical protein
MQIARARKWARIVLVVSVTLEIVNAVLGAQTDWQASHLVTIITSIPVVLHAIASGLLLTSAVRLWFLESDVTDLGG